MLYLFGNFSYTLNDLLECLILTEKDWFIKSYFVLMIISPILNSFTRTTEERIQRIVLSSFLLFEIIFCWMVGGRRFFVDGFGPLHFIGLYLLAQYIHNQIDTSTSPIIYRKLFSMSKWFDLIIWLVSVCLNTTIAVGCLLYFKKIPSFLFAYSAPLVIIGSLYLFLFFSKIQLSYNRTINWIGASSFSVFLLHYAQPIFRDSFFMPQIQYIYNNYYGLACIGIVFVFLLLIYMFAIALDQLRILSWNRLWKLLE